MHMSTLIYGLAATSLTMAQRSPDPGDIPDLKTEGPFALRVKGHDKASSIDGYIRTTESGTFLMPQYEAGKAPIAHNTSYHYYFNYTESMKTPSGIQLGFFLTDPAADKGPSNPYGLKGSALTLQYELRSNVARAVLGDTTAVITGFDDDNQSFLADGLDDANYTPGKLPKSGDYHYYRWAVCWQLLAYTYAPALSWVSWGEARNPTCELVNLIKEPLGY